MTSVATRAKRRPAAGPPSASRRSQAVAGWLFSLPFVLVFLVFYAWPIIWSLLMSLTDMTSRDLRAPFDVNFVGLENFATVLTDPDFFRALLNTAIVVVVAVPAILVIALLLAVAVNNGIRRGKAFFRTVYYIPVVTSIVAIAVVWKFLFADEGTVNAALGLFGADGPAWLADPFWALPTIILLVIWRCFGLVMVIFLAGLQGIPEGIYEAARVDGAGAWRRLVSITVPMLLPTVLLSAVLMTVAVVQVFEEPFVITQGGPLNSTTTMAIYIYDQFGFGKYSTASAASYILFAIIALLSLIQFRLLRSKT
ncbi:sugar ABC transporter permease [Amycolatopsis mediterranei S699]|uniref:Permease component of ABC-type sugar transport system n=2 Tax=Amycolatopsis mediterranei TaxID=33910 RepID=A0A0H3DH59_AMYMU|nr:sugar ABC transporter permease [Amycolatopsis mediterranei]ADJ48974.1 permease component of ABC-type sugar transport system [Amycolatopsis mediterranei U32]AEK45924.1 sugar ABC transporter permease [Amycolatopsis mediterranei S699]AFO80682.1 sugar ABC transporter permease [Amycolatopsis mediterranei S699]AGT87810.1 sugar ABC transporter permease [Amycolatopsis mediterranei RB]KDU93908.1 sugar ABC transporter permease [Amycolatopsis mediterranei]